MQLHLHLNERIIRMKMPSFRSITMVSLCAVGAVLCARSHAETSFKPPEIQGVEEVSGFIYENGAPVGVLRPTFHAGEGKKLIEVNGTYSFPKTNEWDMAAFQLETRDGKKYTPIAISYSYIYWLASSGAYVSVWDDGKIYPVVGLPTKPNKVKFLNEWKGGVVKLKLAFEIPLAASTKRLHHGDAVTEIPKKDTK